MTDLSVLSILKGDHPCIYEVLLELLAKSGAKSVCVVHREEGRWRLDCEVKAPKAKGFWRLPVDRIGQVLGDPARTAVPWWPQPVGTGRPPTWLLVFPVVFRGERARTIRTHFVLVVAPLWICPFEVGIDSIRPYAEWARAVILSWFAWVCYAREERRRFCSESSATQPDRLPAAIRKTLPWPLPFDEVVELVEAGWTPDNRQHNTDWLSDVFQMLCLGGQAGRRCRLGIAPPPCLDDLAARDFESAARFIPWRFPLPPADAEELEGALTGIAALSFKPEEPADPNRPDAMRLDGKALLRFFAEVFWRDWLSRRQTFGLRRGDQERSVRSCACLAHHLVAEMPLDERAIEAVVWAISRYAHDVLRVEPRLDATSHLLQLVRSEPALHVLRPYYRDHFFHALAVCFVGHEMLLGAAALGGRRLIASCRSVLGVRSDEDVLRQWYVAALFHDVGYTMEILRGVQDALVFFKRSGDLTELSREVGKLVEDLSTKLAARDFQGPTPDHRPVEDHGVVAAEHVASLLAHIRRHKGEVGDYGSAVRAIAVHNHRQRTLRFSEEPLSFLLVLCDTVQEWNRPHLLYSTAGATALTRLFYRTEADERRGPVELATLQLPARGAKTRRPIRFKLHYGNQINENAGVFHLWLDISSNLQRLDFDGFPFEVVLDLVTPHFVKGGRGESQMDRLKEAAYETHMNFLAEWFPKPGNKAVLHEYDKHAGLDKLQLNVRELTVRCPVTASMKTFFNLLSRWSRFNEDRVFAGDYAPEPPG